jgi:tetratricopeptide (TPR) repeat protein
VLELPNLFALLEQVMRAGDAAATIDLTTSLFTLLQDAGKPRLLERVAKVRDAATAALGATWNHASFEAQRTRIEEQLANSRLRDALDGAQQLLQRARAVGEKAYPDADYDLAIACFLQARLFRAVGASEQALPLLDEAQKRFETFERDAPGLGAERMASVCLGERGDCLRHLGRLEQAAAAYEESIRRAEKFGDARQAAVGKGQLGTVRRIQGRYKEALEAYEEARERFTRLGEPGTVAVSWHQTGIVYEVLGQPEAAEDAYRKSRAIRVRLGNVAGQASTLARLGNLYGVVLGRREEAVTFHRQAADKYVEIQDVKNEGVVRSNVAKDLRTLGRFDEEPYPVLWFWSQWSDSTDLKNWTSNALRDDASAIVILCAMVSESSSQTLGSYHVEDDSVIDRATLEQFGEWKDWQRLEARIKLTAELTDKEKRAIRLLRRE